MRRLIPVGLLLAILGCDGGGEDAPARSATSGTGAAALDTAALRSGVPHPRPPRPPRGTPRPDSSLSVDTSDRIVATVPDPEDTLPTDPPAAGGLRVMPWSMLTAHADDLLRDLAARQQEHFAEERRYSTATVSGREGWTVRVLFADEQAWAAEATQAFYAGRSCVIWGGDAGGRRPRTARDGRQASAGTPACDSGA